MLTTYLPHGVLIVILLGLSAFFSGSETALTAASRAWIHHLARAGDGRARRVLPLIEDRERLIGAILLGNNLVNILASVLAASVLITLFGASGVVYAALVMTILIVVFAEILPRSYAISKPESVALAVGRPVSLLVFLLAPVVNLVRFVVRGTLAVFGIDLEGREAILLVRDEIRGVIDLGASEGHIRKVHRDMLGSILDLDEISVEDVMIHRKSMTMVDIAEPVGTILDMVIASPNTRLPVYENDNENIIGVLHAKDVLRALRAVDDVEAIDFRAIMTDAWFVPETTTLREQLNAFLSRRAHFALVVDEYGAIQGLVTLEDILEEIVGDITDEFDNADPGIKKLANGWVQVDGAVTIRDLNRRFDWSLPDDDASTIAGLVIFASEIIPIVGQRFYFYGFEIEIVGRRRNQITQLKLRPEGAQI